MHKDSFHIDMSGRIYEGKTIGIAAVGTRTKANYGCALKGNLVRLVKRRLFGKNIIEDSARLYAICIFLIIKYMGDQVASLIICNDEDFKTVRKVLTSLLEEADFDIINIGDFRKRLGKNIGSLADNHARIYRRRALKPTKQFIGRKINVIEVNYRIIEKYWKKSVENEANGGLPNQSDA
jgi:hypothetical protein